MTEITQQDLVRIVRKLDSDNSWRKYQFCHEEDEFGLFRIQKFSIPPWDKKRMRMIMNEGVNRDPGSGDFTKLTEIVPDAGEDGEPKIKVWMSDTRAEILEHTPILNKFYYSRLIKHKRVLINGLGLGLVVHAALTFDSIEHIDVVEHNADVIDLVGQYLTADPRVTIHLADAFDMYWPPGTRWDFAWHDIWPSIDDQNLREMDHLMRKYKGRVAWQGCWQREGCLAFESMLRRMKAGTYPVSKALDFIGGKAPWVT